MGYLDNTGLAYLWGKIKAKLVQPDWQQNDNTAPGYVKNRPGGYDVPEYVITWDGVIGNRLTVPVNDTKYFVKISDEVLSADQLLDGTCSIISDGIVYTIKIKNSWLGETTEYVSLEMDGGVAVVAKASSIVFESWTFPEQGVYFFVDENAPGGSHLVGVTSAPIPVKIPQKYLELDGYAQEGDLAAKADKPTTTEATLLASGWMGENAPYIYNLSVTGVTDTSNQELLPALDITTAQLTALQAANIQDNDQYEDTVSLKAFGTKPTIDLPIRIILRGD
jgi:hypothetical protein